MSGLTRDGDVFILNLGDAENRFNFDSVAALNALLDEVSEVEGPKALVTTATGKFWSNGLDLDWILSDNIDLIDLIMPVQELFARVLLADYPTVAAIQGHCYAAGAMLALAHDARLMREDRGFLCFPEVDIKMVFTAGMQALLTSKLTPQTAHQSMVLGRRFTAPDALAVGILDAVAAEDALLPSAIAYAQSLANKDAATIGGIKRGLYASTAQLLRTAP